MNRAVVSLAIAAALLSGCSTPPTDHKALEKDTAARQIPFLADAPKLDRQASPGEWDIALAINETFSVHDGTPAAGDYPFDLRLSHNATFLFGWLAVHNIPPNPYNNQTPDHDRHGYQLGLFLDSKLAPTLEAWESWKDSIFIEGGTDSDEGYWDGNDWVRNPHGDESPPWDGDRPTGGTWFRGWQENSTINWEFYVPLKPTVDHNDFNVNPNGTFRLSVMFGIQGGNSPDARGRIEEPRDAWPGDGYTPHNYYNASTWARLQLG